MHISSYFKPVQDIILPHVAAHTGKRLGEVFETHSVEEGFPDLEDIEVALFGVDEDRNALDNQGCGMASFSVREYLYRLLPGDYKTVWLTWAILFVATPWMIPICSNGCS